MVIFHSYVSLPEGIPLNKQWLVGATYPSEKWWTTRQLGWCSIPNIYGSSHNHNPFISIPWFQSPPTRVKFLWVFGGGSPLHLVLHPRDFTRHPFPGKLGDLLSKLGAGDFPVEIFPIFWPIWRWESQDFPQSPLKRCDVLERCEPVFLIYHR